MLTLLLIVAGIGWLYQAWFLEQYTWRVKMRPSLLPANMELALQPKDEFAECAKSCPKMIVLPAGDFIMGSPDGTPSRNPSEGPQHKVTIAKPFAVSKFDITFREWDMCESAGACPRALDNNWGREDGPVFNVSWYDAQRYVAWMKRITGKDYRLLTESEWEYASRAGSVSAYPWGDEIGTGNANCDGCGSQWGNKRPAPVGSFRPNAFGLYDMQGNVWKWLEDCFNENYIGAPTDGSAWTVGCSDTIRHVVRGGSWDSEPEYLRTSARGRNSPGFRINYIGFRLARTLNH
jgi:formylglycine-generating enzyme required for sulfatase activity